MHNDDLLIDITKLKNDLVNGFVEIGNIRIDNNLTMDIINELKLKYPNDAEFRCYGDGALHNIKDIKDINGYDYIMRCHIFTCPYSFCIIAEIENSIIKEIVLESMYNDTYEFEDIISVYDWGEIEDSYITYSGISQLRLIYK